MWNYKKKEKFLNLKIHGFTAAAVVGSAVIGAAASSKAAKSARRGQQAAISASERAGEANRDFLEKQNKRSRDDLFNLRDQWLSSQDNLFSNNPYIKAGKDAVSESQQLAGSPLNVDVTQDPGYQFRLSEGLKAVSNSGSARGMGLSGAQLKDLTRYSQGLASQEFGNAYNRTMGLRQQRLGMLSNLQAQGQNTLAQKAGLDANAYSQTMSGIAGVNQQTTSGISGSIMGTGSAVAQGNANIGAINAAGTTGRAATIGQGLQGLGQLAGQGEFSSTDPGAMPGVLS